MTELAVAAREDAARRDASATSVHDSFFLQSREFRKLLQDMLKGPQYARLESVDIREWALSYRDLDAHYGITLMDVKLLLRQGLIQAHSAVTRGTIPFVDESKVNPFDERCVFTLTLKGVGIAQASTGEVYVDGPATIQRPMFHSELRELRFNNVVIKRYREPACNQECVLLAFQEENWPARIDDPLSPNPGIAPKQRLSDTIKNLNKQIQKLIVFSGDGRGEGIRWAPVTNQFSLSV